MTAPLSSRRSVEVHQQAGAGSWESYLDEPGVAEPGGPARATGNWTLPNVLDRFFGRPADDREMHCIAVAGRVWRWPRAGPCPEIRCRARPRWSHGR